MPMRFAIFLMFLAAIGKAQDVHFSQYLLSPLSLNPANTGNFSGDYRLFGNYRSQWRVLDKGYNTFSAGGDMNFFPNNLNVGAGLILINDLSAQYLRVTKILPSVALHKKIAGFKLHAGIQPGVVIKSIDFYKHSFPNQLNWETGNFDPNLPNIESNVGQRFTYFDLNAGFSVSRRIGKLEPVIGLSYFHLSRPRESFVGDRQNKLPVRQALNAELNYDLTRHIVLHLHTLYGSTVKANDWVTGLNVEYVLSRDVFFANSVWLGFMWRDGFKSNFDAGIYTIGMNYQNYTLGFSYDVTRSRLSTSVDSRGAYEIAIIYRAKSTRLKKKLIPCDRI